MSQQEAHHKVGLGETPCCLIRKRYRYSSAEKFEEAFDTALDLMQTKPSSDAAFSAVNLPNFNKCRPEAAGDVISGMALDYVGTYVPASVGDSWLNSGWIIWLFVRRKEGAHDLISGRFVWQIVLETCEIWSSSPEPFSRNSAQSCRKYFRQFFRHNFRPAADNGVISSVAIDYVGLDVHVKFCDSRSNGSQAIRGADFVSSERTRQRLSK